MSLPARGGSAKLTSGRRLIAPAHSVAPFLCARRIHANSDARAVVRPLLAQRASGSNVICGLALSKEQAGQQ
jgi:hypothetical protein